MFSHHPVPRSFGRRRNITFWKLCHIALCGVFGENGMVEVLRDVNGLFLNLKPFSFILS